MQECMVPACNKNHSFQQTILAICHLKFLGIKGIGPPVKSGIEEFRPELIPDVNLTRSAWSTVTGRTKSTSRNREMRNGNDE